MTRWKSITGAPHQQTPVSSPATKARLAHRSWLLALVLVIATFAAYQSVWHAGFVWDDNDHLTANPAMTSPHGLRMIWSSLAVSRYYPLTLTTFWLQRRLWGLNPTPYHLVNITLHAINGILVFQLLRRLRVRAAWLAAMLWVLHPVNVESVAWVTELKNTESGLFFFAAVLCFLRFESDRRPREYALALASGLAAMLCKPSTVILPLALLLCVWWQRGGWKRVDLWRIAPFLIFALGMSAWTIIEQRGHVLRAGTAEWSLGIPERLVIAAKAVWFYAAKLLWPAQLTFVYPRWAVDSESLLSWMPLAGLIVVGTVLWARRRQGWARAGLFACGYFVAALLPVLGFFDVYYFRYSFVADHFQYLACIGLISLVVSAGTATCRRTGQLGRDLGVLAAAIALLASGVCTWRQAHIYQDSETLWGDTLMKNPYCWLAHNNLGLILASSGRVPEAKEHYGQSLRFKPDYAEAHNNLGNVFLREDKVSDAIAQYNQALRSMPDFAEAHNNLGSALLQAGRMPQAIEQFVLALRLEPDSAEPHYNLGSALLQAGRMSEAIGQLEQALRINPDYAQAHYILGNALVRAGQPKEAVSHWERAVHIKPDFVEAYYNLGNALLVSGQIQEAIAHYEQALRLKPDYARAHYSLGIALAQTGSARAAIEQYEQALRIDPNYADACNNLAWLLATLPPEDGGNPVRGLSLAQRVCELARQRVASYLDTLAAAYAATGQFSNAVATAQQAIELARAAQQPQVAEKIQTRLELYRNGQAYRQSLGSTSPHSP